MGSVEVAATISVTDSLMDTIAVTVTAISGTVTVAVLTRERASATCLLRLQIGVRCTCHSFSPAKDSATF